jgi:hypothetical protein
MPEPCLRLAEPGALDGTVSHGSYLEDHLEPTELGTRCKPRLRRTAQAPGLLGTHSLKGMSVARTRTRLHFTEDQAAAAPGDDVQLIPTRTCIRREDAVAAQPVMAAYAPLGVTPELARRPRAAHCRPGRSSTEPGTSGGGSRRGLSF